MVRFPYTLEVSHEDEAIRNPDGSYTEGSRQWRKACRCNARQNGKARQIKGQNGQAFIYSYEVIMPANAESVPIGTIVRILDSRRNASIFQGRVQGFYKSGQRNEDTRLWL